MSLTVCTMQYALEQFGVFTVEIDACKKIVEKYKCGVSRRNINVEYQGEIQMWSIKEKYKCGVSRRNINVEYKGEISSSRNKL